MKAELVLTFEARADIAEAAAWYRGQSVLAAERFFAAVGIAFAKIAAHPTAHAILDAETGTRRALLKKFPQRVLYLIDGNRAVVFAVVHHRRDKPVWQERLK